MKKKVKCNFDYNGECWALKCHSQSECNARDEYGNPKYIKGRKK